MLPDYFIIDLSETKASLLLEVLKLQTQKRPVELRGWSDEESEVRSFLQCLPYISHLSFYWKTLYDQRNAAAVQFLVNLSVAAAEWDSTSGGRLAECLSSSCSHSSFPFTENCETLCVNEMKHQFLSDFLLSLCVHLQSHEGETARRLLSSFQYFCKMLPDYFSIDLSKTKASLLLEVLKLQTQKRPVELRGWSDEESEVRSFLQCLPYISHLRLSQIRLQKNPNEAFEFLLDLSMAAADSDCVSAAGESFSDLFSSVCNYSTFPFGQEDNSKQSDLLLELYSYMMGYESKHDRSLLSAFIQIYQSAPAVWSIDLSKTKASLLLEVLKLQTQKRPVELRGWSDEESEVRSFLQCLPYISHLR
ncbi:uncharacterized protein LOC134467111 [Engraulis encrasicolus]|uniref:uncharacterized protein LOC134467111 n=1 Tax=Engraulis encrasicolus TaxID=184585 RepID=UPI002FCE75BF